MNQFKAEKIAKIGTTFVQYSFGLWLDAVIITASVIKSAVQAAMKIGTTGRTLCLSADKIIRRNFFFAFLAKFHTRENTSIVE